MLGTVRTVVEDDGVYLVAVAWDDGTATETPHAMAPNVGDRVPDSAAMFEE